MEVDRLLNFERRTGVKDSEIDEFTAKADAVQKAIQAMMRGEIAPEDVKIEGIDTDEEIRQKEIDRVERKRVMEEKSETLRVQRKKEEIDRWWDSANIMKPKADASTDQAIENKVSSEEEEALQRARYNFDYSRWDTWVPNDEATVLEAQEEEKRQEVVKNKEFENNNKEFCGNFLEDMHKREESRKKKEENAEKNRIKGNKFFQAKKFDRANELYMEALKESPFDVKTLTNIAQAHIKQKNYLDALEFLSRTLYLDSDHIKALSRKAFILSETGKTVESQATIQHALSVDPTNPDVISLAKEINIMV
jgi:tetratricopeptide (TPR) repeat protein